MISGKLGDIKHDPSNVQVVDKKIEEGELSLQDMDGVFFKSSSLKEELSRGSPAPGSEALVPVLESSSSRKSPTPYSGKRESFSLEEKQLEKVLSLHQTELAKTNYSCS